MIERTLTEHEYVSEILFFRGEESIFCKIDWLKIVTEVCNESNKEEWVSKSWRMFWGIIDG